MADSASHPLHAAGHFLTPKFYSDSAIEDDEEVVSDFYKCLVMSDFYKCLQKLFPDEDLEDKISEELSFYKKAKEAFSLPMAIIQHAKKAPGKT